MENTGKAAIAEFVATFGLVFIGASAVILNASSGVLDLTGVALAQGLVLAIMVSITAHLSGGFVNPAVTIGLVIAFDIMAFGPLTGAAVNPARWLGPALAASAWDNWFVWIVGPVAGAIVAAVVYSMVFLKDQQLTTL